MEDVEEDFSRDVDQDWMLQTLPAVGEGDLGLTEAELDEASVQQELSAHQPGQAGALEQREQTAWTGRQGEVSQVSHSEVTIVYLGKEGAVVLGEHFLSSCLDILDAYRDSSSGEHSPPPPRRSRPPGGHHPAVCSSPL